MTTAAWVLVFDTGVQVTRTRKTVDGFLEVWGVAAAEGVMDYPERGFSAYVPGDMLAATVQDLRGKPVTREHPDGTLIDATNAAQYTLGTVLDAQYDEENRRVLVHLVVYDQELIDEIESKRRAQLSPGYRTKFDALTSPVEGATKTQTTRVYNHLAVVEAARGGDECRIFDSKPPQDKVSDMADMPKPADAAPAPPQPPQPPKPAEDAYTARMDAMEAKLDALMGMLKPKGEDKPDEPKDADEDKSMDEDEDEDESMDSLVTRVRQVQRAADALRVTIPDTMTSVLDMERAVAVALVGDSARTMKAAALQGVIAAANASKGKTAWHMSRQVPAADAASDGLPPLKQDPWLEAARRRSK